MKYDIGRAARRGAILQKSVTFARAAQRARMYHSYRAKGFHSGIIVCLLRQFTLFVSAPAVSGISILPKPDRLQRSSNNALISFARFPFLRLRMRVHFATSVQRVQLNRTHAIGATRLARRDRLDISRIRRPERSASSGEFSRSVRKRVIRARAFKPRASVLVIAIVIARRRIPRAESRASAAECRNATLTSTSRASTSRFRYRRAEPM